MTADQILILVLVAAGLLLAGGGIGYELGERAGRHAVSRAWLEWIREQREAGVHVKVRPGVYDQENERG